jgi:5-methyltetrahydropteroyltriglutamate--homocysteine methyltransferase
MAKTAILGFPRMGKARELKRALEDYWKGELPQEKLLAVSQQLKQKHWQLQKKSKTDYIPSNDFSFYDQVLDTSIMAGAVPDRFNWPGDAIDLELYFAMARGRQDNTGNVPAMEMTKWFDTNYHYLVPEFKSNQIFKLHSLKPVEEFAEAKALGIHTRPVLLGPVSYLLLGKMTDSQASPLQLLDRLLPVYQEVLFRLAEAGADWIQMDEPVLVLDYDKSVAEAIRQTYRPLAALDERLKIQLTSYFGGMEEYLDLVFSLPVHGVHLDLDRAPEQMDQALTLIQSRQQLSLGLINGRNIWRADFKQLLPLLEKAVKAIGKECLIISSSCSLLHVPFSLEDEESMDADIKAWLAFSVEKLDELNLLREAANQGKLAVADELAKRQAIIQFRHGSEKVNRRQVQERCRKVNEGMKKRGALFTERKKQQQEKLKLPVLPTTTIGSFPQTQEVRSWRRDYKAGKISPARYQDYLKEEIRKCIAFQEEIGLDVLVHGEFERNDMVEYFGELLEGFVFTRNGWVQSYGSRCVKPPVIFGDIERKAAMTTAWSAYAQALTDKPVKGMLTGPVTILQWSFVRDDQPRADTCQQIALAIRDEVKDLEKSGIKVIQIDEPALREGLPLKKTAWQAYLSWGGDCFRLASAGVKDETQIHTHMCYGDFEDIFEAIAALDADVISIEASRSGMGILKAFGKFHFKTMKDIVKKALEVVPAAQVWINPDCGLKTRDWKEVKSALRNLVETAKELRLEITQKRVSGSSSRT